MIEYSQTLIFNSETMEKLGTIEDFDHATEISFNDVSMNEKFLEVLLSWNIFTSKCKLTEQGKIRVLANQKAIDAYNYAMFMDLIISFLKDDFKMKEPK